MNLLNLKKLEEAFKNSIFKYKTILKFYSSLFKGNYTIINDDKFKSL